MKVVESQYSSPEQFCFKYCNEEEKSRIRETPTLSTDADSSTAAKKLLSIFLLSLPAAVDTAAT